MKSLIWQPTVVKATERILDAIYAAAYSGLKGDSLAVAAGLSPQQLNALCELDPAAKEHMQRGRADSELEHATMLARASREGDAKASLAILQHIHGWTAKTEISMNVTAISITQALAEAEGRVISNQ